MTGWIFALFVGIVYMAAYLYFSRNKAKKRFEDEYRSKYGTRKPPPPE
jgi:hypothetical protein